MFGFLCNNLAAMAQQEEEAQGEDETLCRICAYRDGLGGLADLLIEPCSCSGSMAYVHISCLHNWQVTKAQQLRDPTTCELCRQAYRIPEGAVQALEAQGVIRQVPWTTRLRHAVVKLRGALARLSPLFYMAETALAVLGAADYALRAYSMMPAVLSDPGGCMRQYGWEYGWKSALTVVSMLCYPVVAALRVDADQAHRELFRASSLVHCFFSTTFLAAAQVGYCWLLRAAAGEAGLPPEVRLMRMRALHTAEAIASVSFPLAAAFVGGCVAWWRLQLSWARPSAFETETMQAASRVLAAVDSCGVADRITQAVAMVHSSAQEWACLLRDCWGVCRATIQCKLLGKHLWRDASPGQGGKPWAGQGLAEGRLWSKLLRFADARGGLDLAGIFSA